MFPREYVVLMGGSNSVKKTGLRYGLSQEVELYSLALGATSSLQNLHEVIRNRDRIKQALCVVSESNINDFHNVITMNLDIDYMTDIINSYYYELSKVNRNAVCVIIPINKYIFDRKRYDVFNRICDEHVRNAKNYNFPLVNLRLATSKIKPEDYKLFFPDPLHPDDSFMSHLGRNIGSYIHKNRFELSVNRLYSLTENTDYSLLRAEDFGPESMTAKSNSIFSENILTLNGKIKIPSKYEGLKILGVHTWCNGYSKLAIQNNKRMIIKPLSGFLSFNELIDDLEIDNNTYMWTSNESNSTEKSVNVPDDGKFNNAVNICSLLLGKGLIKSDLEAKKKLVKSDLNRLIPDIVLHISSAKRLFLALSKDSSTVDVNAMVDTLRNSAIKIESHDVKVARNLMAAALKLRPNGPLIKAKLIEYDKILSSRAQTPPNSKAPTLRTRMTFLSNLFRAGHSASK